MVLNEVVYSDLRPLKKGGVTFYPASSLSRIFAWAEGQGRTLNRVEGVFYRPSTHAGQLCSAFTMLRRDQVHADFKRTCLALIDEFEAEAASKDMGAYFEIGISPPVTFEQA